MPSYPENMGSMKNRTVEDRPRDRKRTSRAKSLTITRKYQRAAKRAAQGR